jgi:hypothetical protein
MPLASLIGSGMGILNPWNLKLIIEQSSVPVLVDAGVGTASDAAIAMELGCDGVLMNTAIAAAGNPVMMAHAMKLAVEAGRAAYCAERMPKRFYSAVPSSPSEGDFFSQAVMHKSATKSLSGMLQTFPNRVLLLKCCFLWVALRPPPRNLRILESMPNIRVKENEPFEVAMRRFKRAVEKPVC